MKMYLEPARNRSPAVFVSLLLLAAASAGTACAQTTGTTDAQATGTAGVQTTGTASAGTAGSVGAQTKAKGWNEVSFDKPSDAALRQTLTPIQYTVTQEDDTERPFDNEYWDNKRAGIYVDVASGEPLFSSLDKFDSQTGWPSFTKPLEEENIRRKVDRKLIFKRIEVRSKHADSHLGHVFDDGPAPTGLRYCINSAALKFIPVERLKAEGYEEYLSLF